HNRESQTPVPRRSIQRVQHAVFRRSEWPGILDHQLDHARRAASRRGSLAAQSHEDHSVRVEAVVLNRDSHGAVLGPVATPYTKTAPLPSRLGIAHPLCAWAFLPYA